MASPTPHPCSHCRTIEIDGTGPNVEQTFGYTFDSIAACAIECAFYRWAQDLTTTGLKGTDELTLSISQDSKDIAYMQAIWGEKNGESASGRVIAQSMLYVFTRGGVLP